MEGYLTEVGIVKSELNAMLRHLDRWAKPRRVGTPLAHFPSRSMVWPEPYGVVPVSYTHLSTEHYLKWPNQDGTVDVYVERNVSGELIGCLLYTSRCV